MMSKEGRNEGCEHTESKKAKEESCGEVRNEREKSAAKPTGVSIVSKNMQNKKNNEQTNGLSFND